ncbi:atrial natriuretic peptide receptor 1-like [Ptychodera flava]|uniref:atrial natriuretic peptide receptor 1-like n=1 Tax=Ptychodera flava TaxID=63121 RepID=UPI00396A0895
MRIFARYAPLSMNHTQGMTGNLLIDEFGDREPDYWITDLQPNGAFEKISEVLSLENGTRIVRHVRLPRWGDGRVGHEYAPRDRPTCGFDGEFCKGGSYTYIYIISFAAAAFAIVGATILFVYLFRHFRYESDLMNMRWKILYDEIQLLNMGSRQRANNSNSQASLNKNSASNNLGSTGSNGAESNATSRSVQYFCKTGIYRGVHVAVKKIKKEHMQVTRSVLIEFSEDLLENDDIKLDRAFKVSFFNDIVKGLEYLHKSKHGNGSHGNLKSSNCLIDSRWVVKITDYGLPSFLQGQTQDVNADEHDKFLRKLWTAPEILRMNFPPACGTQKGDIYSFGIILFEITERSRPYAFDHITPRDVVNRIRNGESTPYRPVIQASTHMQEMGEDLLHLMVTCWAENPEDRPYTAKIRSRIKTICGGENVSIMDNILNMMEKYSNNLEDIVEERTEQLLDEKRKTDRLLYRMLPPSVAEQLKIGNMVDPQNYDAATVYFSDIVGFTTLASESTPIQVVDFLNDLYSCFDAIISNHDVYKVETIGDAYMIVSGVPQRNGNRHAAEIANCALDLLSTVTHFKIRHRPRDKLQLRIGVHSGPVVAGVVGLVMPRYCLFGDTVNMASRMESTGKPFHIHISKQTYCALSDLNVRYHTKVRGEINVKGKGLITTYFLLSKEGYKSPLPQDSSVKTRDGDDTRLNDNVAERGGDEERTPEGLF